MVEPCCLRYRWKIKNTIQEVQFEWHINVFEALLDAKNAVL